MADRSKRATARRRWLPAVVGLLALLLPTLGFIAAWRTDRPLWRIWHPVWQAVWRLVTGQGIDVLLILVAILLLGAVVAVILSARRADTELLFGAATVFLTLFTVLSTLTALMPWLHPAKQGTVWFATLVAFWAATLWLIAHDWTRRLLKLASIVAVLLLGAFVARVGYDDLQSIEQKERAAVLQKAADAKKQLDEQADTVVIRLSAAADTAAARLSGAITGMRPMTAEVRGPTRAACAVLASPRKNPPPRVPSYLTAVPPAMVNTFDHELAAQPPKVPAIVAKLGTATHGFVTAVSSIVTRPALMTAADHTAATAIKQAKDAQRSGAWPTEKQNLVQALTSYRAAVTGADPDATPYDTLLNTPPPRSDPNVTVLDGVTQGPETLWTSAVDTGRPLVPGPFGWVLLGALALGFWAWLLRMNASQLAGPVLVPKADDADGDLQKVLRVAVLENLDEPGATPGAKAVNPVTDLLDAIPGPSAALSKVLGVATAIAGRRYGYEVTIDAPKATAEKATAKKTAWEKIAEGIAKHIGIEAVASEPGPASNPTPPGMTPAVLARIRSIDGGRTFAAKVHQGGTMEAAVRSAGLWAAGYILNRSSRIPSWAAWDADTAHALVTANQPQPELADLIKAVRTAPNSGMLLVLLGHRYEIEEQPIEAVEMYARAVTAHPRYLLARYRLSAGLVMLANEDPLDAGSQERVRRAIHRAASALHISDPSFLHPSSLRAPSPEELRAAGRAFLEHLDADTRYGHRMAASLRRSDRDALLPGLLPRSTNAAAHFNALVRSACLAQDIPPQENCRPGDRIRLEDDPRRWWQVSYNLACGYARAQRYNDALDLLEQTLVRPGIHQLNAAWVMRDSDLRGLHGHPRFEAYVAQLRAEPAQAEALTHATP